ncbi:hypothetical protein [Pseudomonas sp. M30-35]|uniref:hypothetical protein n=1 Tax=Pseudomonas sp. M30-35 TaxID=1981174 RepID=UPI000B3BE221|nr:hypothetical protein [Pseudomonas sp. M30-35]ARU87332.1 hypothetical protein B9K09_04750 [Pseudomonas sp. M30-35]
MITLQIILAVMFCVAAFEICRSEIAKSKSAFRTARYLVALLWHWSIPFVLGCLAASVVSLMGIQQGLMQVTDVLDEAIQQAVQACGVADQPPDSRSPSESGTASPSRA